MKKIVVSVIIGSDSDLPVMKEALDILKEFNISFETLILSAHRSPEETAKYARELSNRGIKVVIAGAGGAAHLAGVIAAHFPLPVIGVPIKSSALDGADALYSVVQMPPGIPVATVAINGTKNAALLAVQILATNDKKLSSKIREYKITLAKNVLAKSEKLKKLGINKYLEINKK